MVRTFLKVYMVLGFYFLFLQEEIKDIIIITSGREVTARAIVTQHGVEVHAHALASRAGN